MDNEKLLKLTPGSFLICSNYCVLCNTYFLCTCKESGQYIIGVFSCFQDDNYDTFLAEQKFSKHTNNVDASQMLGCHF